jgi:hypothetical protein
MNLFSVVFTVMCVMSWYGTVTIEPWVLIAWGFPGLLCGLIKIIANASGAKE